MAKGRNGFKGMGGGFGGANLNQLMKQAQKMQAEMAKAQEELSTMEFEGTAGGGMVKVTLNGEHKLLSCKIQKEAVDPDDVEMLEDLVLVAVNDAIKKASETSNSKMSGFTGGLPSMPTF